MSNTEVTTQTARKQYRCEWCWERIEAGATYRRWRSFYDGPATMRMHPECHGAMELAIQDEGGFLEWTPGQERPMTPNVMLCGGPAQWCQMARCGRPVRTS